MSDIESKHEKTLKKIQLWVGVLAGITSLVIGAYNINKIFFEKKEPEPVRVVETKSDALRSAVEEVGASWIRELAASKRDKN